MSHQGECHSPHFSVYPSNEILLKAAVCPISTSHSSFRPKASKNKNVGIYLLAGTIVMIGLSYLAVPLYRIFCQTTGMGGTTHKGMNSLILPNQKSWQEQEGGDWHFQGTDSDLCRTSFSGNALDFWAGTRSCWLVSRFAFNFTLLNI